MLINKTSVFLSIVFFSFLLGRFNLNIGFSLKPYMIASLAIFLLYFSPKNLKFQIFSFEKAFLILILLGGFTTLFAADFTAASRLFFLAIIVMLSSIIVSNFYFVRIAKLETLEQALIITAFLFNFISLIMYLIGMNQVLGNFGDFNSQDLYGLTIDRGLPRLIGLSFDPNFYAMYNSLFIFFLIFKQRNFFDNIILGLAFLTTLLTLSRGGYLAVFLPIVFFIFKSLMTFKFSRSLFMTLSIIIVLTISSIFISGDFFYQILESRMSDLNSGSGRFELIAQGLRFFSENPLFGVGWHNFRYYNLMETGYYHYGHNTFVEILAELGIVGFSIYVIFLYLLFNEISKISQKIPFTNFLKFALASILLSMFFLSSIVNELFFLFMIIVKCYSLHARKIMISR